MKHKTCEYLDNVPNKKLCITKCTTSSRMDWHSLVLQITEHIDATRAPRSLLLPTSQLLSRVVARGCAAHECVAMACLCIMYELLYRDNAESTLSLHIDHWNPVRDEKYRVMHMLDGHVMSHCYDIVGHSCSILVNEAIREWVIHLENLQRYPDVTVTDFILIEHPSPPITSRLILDRLSRSFPKSVEPTTLTAVVKSEIQQMVAVVVDNMTTYSHQPLDVEIQGVRVGSGSYGKVEKFKRGGQRWARKRIDTASSHYWVREVAAMKMINHPNCVPIANFHMSNEGCLIEMPMMGKNLSHTRVPSRHHESVMHDVLAAVGYMHELGITHRDIRPANLLWSGLDQQRPVRLADMGLARVVGPVDQHNPDAKASTRQTSDLLSHWSPPESVLGATRMLWFKYDVWQLGLTSISLWLGRDAPSVNTVRSMAAVFFHGDKLSPDRWVKMQCTDIASVRSELDDVGSFSRSEQRRIQETVENFGTTLTVPVLKPYSTTLRLYPWARPSVNDIVNR